MHSSFLAPSVRRAAAVILALALGAGAAVPARASTTELADDSGVLHIDAPGKWRTQKGDQDIVANGFLGGTKRAELFGVVYADLKTADAAARRWKAARLEEAEDVTFTHTGDVHRWTAQSASSGTVDYVRALEGAEKAAVVWVRLSGAPGAADSDAAALLEAARLAVPEAEQPAGGETGGGTTSDGEEVDETVGVVQKDPDFRVQIRLPDGFELRKDIQPAVPRGISAVGTVGTDTEAFFDLYLFDDFERADACGKWWRETERMGWKAGVRLDGDTTSFKVEVRDETWTRHVRIVATDAGIVGIKLDAASQVEAAALTMVDAVLGSIQVLKPRLDVPTAPPGMKSQTTEKSILQHELPDEDAANPFQFEADVVEEHVLAVTKLDAPAGRLAVLRVYEDAAALANALRPLGITDGRDAHWWVREGAVVTHGGALDKSAGKAAVRMELSRASLQRRLGFRAPFWLERGVGHLIASAAYNKGRVDGTHPRLVEAVRDAAPSGVELQSVRWWGHVESASHPERDAIAWSYVHFFLHAGSAGRKYEESFYAYIALMKSSGDPVEAGSAFDFARETELAEDWQLWARKL